MASALTKADERPETASEVVVASVPVAEVKVKVVRVEDAPEIKPLPKTRVVEVEFSVVPRVLNGNAKLGEDESVPLVSERLEPMERGTMAPLA